MGYGAVQQATSLKQLVSCVEYAFLDFVLSLKLDNSI